jgi:hypothetical protein
VIHKVIIVTKETQKLLELSDRGGVRPRQDGFNLPRIHLNSMRGQDMAQILNFFTAE